MHLSSPSTLAGTMARPVAPAGAGAGAGAVRARLDALDRAKGMAILLVVFGHLVAREEPAGLTWYEPLRIGIYLFHMPFFMYLSGYIAVRFGAERLPLRAWPALVGRRAIRLLAPFAAFGLFTLVAKLGAARLVQVDNVPSDLWHGLAALVWNTSDSPATSIWYVGVLFVYASATPLLLMLGAQSLALALGVSVLLFAASAPPVLYLDHICRFYLFFVLGGLAARADGRWLSFITRWRWPALAGLVAVAAFVASGQVQLDWSEAMQGGPYRWYLLAAGLLSLPALHGLALLRPPGMARPLAYLGRTCFIIYLLNTLFIGAAKAIGVQVLTWTAADFPLFAVLLMAAGTIGPLLVKRWALAPFPRLDRLTD